jgi:hypothetical protein
MLTPSFQSLKKPTAAYYFRSPAGRCGLRSAQKMQIPFSKILSYFAFLHLACVAIVQHFQLTIILLLAALAT